MSLIRWSRAPLAALVLAAGCKSENPPSTAVQDPSTPAAATAPAKAPAPAPAPPPAPKPAPVSGLALSYLMPVDPERCEWLRQPVPSGEPTSVFTFNAACDRSMVSWSPNGREGLVFTWPSGRGEIPRAWRVDLTAHTGKPIDLKTLPGGTGAGNVDLPYIDRLGFTRQGSPVALIVDMFVNRKPEKGPGGKEFITFGGKRYPLDEGEDGAAGLAHAYRLEEGGWKHLETRGSHFESDLAPGVRTLEAFKALMPIAKASPPEQRMPGTEAPEAAVKKLDAAFPGQDESGQWMALSSPSGLVYYRGTLGGEFLYPSAPVAWEQGGKLVELDGLMAKPDDVLDLQVQDGLLLIANYGAPRVAQIWDARTKERVLSLEEANAPIFWPPPASP